MAVYKIFPQKDATLYSLYPSASTGLDEIIEATIIPSAELLTTLPQASRFLIQFSQTEMYNVSTSLALGSSAFSASLRCFAANVTNIGGETVIDVLAASGSWNNGTGKFGDTPQTQNGVSWVYKSSYGVNPWSVSNFIGGSTGSFQSTNPGGGTWYTSSQYNQSQTFEYPNSTDINIDVTSTVNAWTTSQINNDGFIIKQRQEFLTSSDQTQTLKFFSIDTNTIYPPCLELKWRDYSYNKGTNPIITGDNIYVSLESNPGVFKQDSVNVFRLNVRPKFPTRQFQITPLYTNNYYLPSSSYYAIQDVDTNEYIVDFDEIFTQVSADGTSSFFTLYMNGLEPERYYKIVIKTSVSGNTFIVDNNNYFKIIK